MHDPYGPLKGPFETAPGALTAPDRDRHDGDGVATIEGELAPGRPVAGQRAVAAHLQTPAPTHGPGPDVFSVGPGCSAKELSRVGAAHVATAAALPALSGHWVSLGVFFGD